MTETKRTGAQIRADMEYCVQRIDETAASPKLQYGWYATLGTHARTDIPRLLDAAVKLRRWVNEYLIYLRRAGYLISAREVERDFADTAWLAEPAPEPESPEGGEGEA